MLLSEKLGMVLSASGKVLKIVEGTQAVSLGVQVGSKIIQVSTVGVSNLESIKHELASCKQRGELKATLTYECMVKSRVQMPTASDSIAPSFDNRSSGSYLKVSSSALVVPPSQSLLESHSHLGTVNLLDPTVAAVGETIESKPRDESKTCISNDCSTSAGNALLNDEKEIDASHFNGNHVSKNPSCALTVEFPNTFPNNRNDSEVISNKGSSQLEERQGLRLLMPDSAESLTDANFDTKDDQAVRKNGTAFMEFIPAVQYEDSEGEESLSKTKCLAEKTEDAVATKKTHSDYLSTEAALSEHAEDEATVPLGALFAGSLKTKPNEQAMTPLSQALFRQAHSDSNVSNVACQGSTLLLVRRHAAAAALIGRRARLMHHATHEALLQLQRALQGDLAPRGASDEGETRQTDSSSLGEGIRLFFDGDGNSNGVLSSALTVSDSRSQVATRPLQRERAEREARARQRARWSKQAAALQGTVLRLEGALPWPLPAALPQPYSAQPAVSLRSVQELAWPEVAPRAELGLGIAARARFALQAQWKVQRQLRRTAREAMQAEAFDFLVRIAVLADTGLSYRAMNGGDLVPLEFLFREFLSHFRAPRILPSREGISGDFPRRCSGSYFS